VEKFMGLRAPFTILRNVQATTSPIAPSVDLVAISELAHGLHQTEHGLFRVPSKNKSATRDFCEAPHLREIGQEG
jgi:hypothetical protein